MEKTIYNLGFHEELFLKDQDCYVVRVPGGWFYKYLTEVFNEHDCEYNMEVSHVIFVPYTEDLYLDALVDRCINETIINIKSKCGLEK